jgi:hypothetical protein
MAAVAFTKATATPNQLVYIWDGDANGTLAYATILADAVDGPLKAALAALDGECDSNTKAASALLIGAPFTGVSGKSITSNIQSSLVYQQSTAAKYPGTLTAVDSGAGNDPNIVIGVEAQSAGILFITHRHSVIL